MKLGFGIAIVAATAALGACSREPEVSAHNASIAEVAEAAKGATKIEPGKWRTTVSVEKMEMPGAPPQVAEMMRQQTGKAAQSSEMCITKEQAEKPPQELLGSAAKDCRYEKFEMKGGALDAVMVCKQAGNEMRSTVRGSYGGTRYDLAGTAEMSTAGQKMIVSSKVVGERIGDCDKAS